MKITVEMIEKFQKIRESIREAYRMTEDTDYDVYVFADGGRTNLMTGNYIGEICDCDGGCPSCTIVAKIEGWSILNEQGISEDDTNGNTKDGHVWVSSNKEFCPIDLVVDELIDEYLLLDDVVTDAIKKAVRCYEEYKDEVKK